MSLADAKISIRASSGDVDATLVASAKLSSENHTMSQTQETPMSIDMQLASGRVIIWENEIEDIHLLLDAVNDKITALRASLTTTTP